MTLDWRPRAIVQVGEQRFDSWEQEGLILRVGVELTTDEASEATFDVHDPDKRWISAWASGSGLRLMPVRVWLGFDNELELQTPLFEGLLAKAKRTQGGSMFTFRDYSMKMRQQSTGYFKGVDDVGVIAQLAQRNGLRFEGPMPAIKLDKHKSLKQEGQSDWEFARDRAQEAGLVLYVRGQTLYAKEAAKTGTPLFEVIEGETEGLLDTWWFNHATPETEEARPGKVGVRANDRNGKPLRGESKVNRGHKRTGVNRDLAIKTKRTADRRAEARKALQREHAFEGFIELFTDFKSARPDVRKTIQCSNFAPLTDGRYLVDNVSHEYDAGNGSLTSGFELYRDIAA